MADWVTATYPWRSHAASQSRQSDLPLLRLRPEDVGVSSTSLGDHVTRQLPPEVDQGDDDPLVNIASVVGFTENDGPNDTTRNCSTKIYIILTEHKTLRAQVRTAS